MNPRPPEPQSGALANCAIPTILIKFRFYGTLLAPTPLRGVDSASQNVVLRTSVLAALGSRVLRHASGVPPLD